VQTSQLEGCCPAHARNLTRKCTEARHRLLTPLTPNPYLETPLPSTVRAGPRAGPRSSWGRRCGRRVVQQGGDRAIGCEQQRTGQLVARAATVPVSVPSTSTHTSGLGKVMRVWSSSRRAGHQRHQDGPIEAAQRTVGATLPASLPYCPRESEPSYGECVRATEEAAQEAAKNASRFGAPWWRWRSLHGRCSQPSKGVPTGQSGGRGASAGGGRGGRGGSGSGSRCRLCAAHATAIGACTCPLAPHPASTCSCCGGTGGAGGTTSWAAVLQPCPYSSPLYRLLRHLGASSVGPS
jgi:hypothetical protein